jgi:predicted lipoprotein with Yx(FWY)xxD motif
MRHAPSAPPSATPTGRGTNVITADSPFGAMLYDASGQAIYLFDAETTSRPECYDACAEAWPPVLTKGAPRATRQVNPGLLGTTRRSEGTTQVTYAGHPLYFYRA